MAKHENDTPQHRKFPDFYEKFIPITIGVMAVIAVGFTLFAIAVAVGLI